MTTWEKEKAYCEKRAIALRAEMETAIQNRDKEKFEFACKTAMRYMSKKELRTYYRRFLERMALA